MMHHRRSIAPRHILSIVALLLGLSTLAQAAPPVVGLMGIRLGMSANDVITLVEKTEWEYNANLRTRAAVTRYIDSTHSIQLVTSESFGGCAVEYVTLRFYQKKVCDISLTLKEYLPSEQQEIHDCLTGVLAAISRSYGEADEQLAPADTVLSAPIQEEDYIYISRWTPGRDLEIEVAFYCFKQSEGTVEGSVYVDMTDIPKKRKYDELKEKERKDEG